MYIDFHIHAYADEIADRAVQKLKDTANCEAYTNGRIDDTRQKLKEWGLRRFTAGCNKADTADDYKQLGK